MNYLKEAEDIIKNCGKLQDSLQNLKNRKTHLLLKTQPKEASGIDYSKPNIQKQSYSNDTLSQLCEIAQVNEQIKETEAEIKIVKEANYFFYYFFINFLIKKRCAQKTSIV